MHRPGPQSSRASSGCLVWGFRCFSPLPSLVLGVVLLVIVLGSCAIGVLVGRRLHGRHETAVGRYELRRAAVVDEANAIGTTYLRAQTIAEPQRSQSLALLRRYTDTSLTVSRTVPGSAPQVRATGAGERLQRQLWTLAGQALNAAPTDSAPRLYVESLNEISTRTDLERCTPQPRAHSSPHSRDPRRCTRHWRAGAASRDPRRPRCVHSDSCRRVGIVILFVTFDLDRP